jgi:hypothetical protein
MDLTDAVVEGRARQDWYRCPVCAAIQTVCSPTHETLLRRVGNATRCSCGSPQATRTMEH